MLLQGFFWRACLEISLSKATYHEEGVSLNGQDGL